MKRAAPAPQPGGGIGQPFVPWPVAQTSQRVNGSGKLARVGTGRGSQTIQTTIGAGLTTQFPAAGQSFYLRAASGPLNIRAKGDAFDSYTPGTGSQADPDNLFDLVEVQNPSAFPVAFSLWVGFGNFIDRRLILETGVIFPVTKITYSPTPPVAGPILIPDISGQSFQDQDGNHWVALSRLYFYVDNLDTANNLVVQNFASSGVSAGIVFPATTRTFVSAGNFSLKNGLAAINAGVQEIYNALQSTT
jgi:hypothetical protein